MSEIDLIVKYLEKRAGKVKDYTYYSEVANLIADDVYKVGANDGYPDQDVFFFGHVSLDVLINGVVVLTNANLLVFNFNTTLKSRSTDSAFKMAVNLGMSGLGDGTYVGEKRIYGIGFNRFSVAQSGFGAATYSVYMALNGYLFEIQ